MKRVVLLLACAGICSAQVRPISRAKLDSLLYKGGEMAGADEAHLFDYYTAQIKAFNSAGHMSWDEVEGKPRSAESRTIT